MKISKTYIYYVYGMFSILCLYLISLNFNPLLYFIPTLIFISFLLLDGINRPNKQLKLLLLFLAIYALILLGGIIFYGYGLEEGYTIEGWKYIIYLTVYLVPLMMLASQLAEKNYNVFCVSTGATVIILSIAVYLSYMNEIIEVNRYQQVGNMLALSAIYSLFIPFKGVRWLVFASFFLLVLTVGSRQGLAGLLVAVTIYILQRDNRLIIKSGLFLAISSVSILLIYNTSIIYYLAQYSKLFERVSRYLTHEEPRVEIYHKVFNELTFYPHYYDFNSIVNNIGEHTPHNLFLEIAYIAGIPAAIVFFLYIVTVMIRMLSATQTLITLASLMYFVPANVSSGLSSSKYYFFFLAAYFGYLKVHHSRVMQIRKIGPSKQDIRLAQ